MRMSTVWQAFAGLSVAAVWAGEPAAVWVSQPVEPGEAVMVFGGPWTNVTAVEVTAPQAQTLKPLSVTADCVTFVYPKAWPLAALGGRVMTGAGVAEFRVNAPEVWWLQGDAGHGASPGGWLRACGRCMAYGARAFIELRDGGKTFKLPGCGDLYGLRTELPKDLPAADYQVFLSNGLDPSPVCAGSVSVKPLAEPWPEKVFDIAAYGAVANDGNDDTRAIRSALAELEKAGGGVLFVPRGRFGLRGELALPPKTLLRGAGEALSQLYWLDEDDPKGALVSGTRDFGVEEIFLSAANIDEGLVVRPLAAGEAWKNENILLRNVRVRFLHTDSATAEETFRRGRSGGLAYRIAGDFVRVTGCDFYTSKGESSLQGEYLYAVSNRFEGPGCNYLGGRRCIFEANNHEGRGISFANGTREYLMRDNRIGGVYGDGDRETFTTDGGRTAYSGKPAAVSPAGLSLPPGAWRDGPDAWVGEAVLVIGGRGAGQERLVRAIRGREVELDRPWDIRPDVESYVVVGKSRHRLLFIDNRDRDGNPFQLYGSATDVVLAGNRFERCSGANAFGMSKGGSPEASWFVQFLENEIVEGNAVRGPMSFNVPALDGWLAFFDRGIVKPLTYPENRVGIMRRNRLGNNAYIDSHGRVENLLLENNVVKQADRGIVVAESVAGAVLRGNRFEGVLRPYLLGQQVPVGAADRLIAGLSAVRAALGSALPAAWPALEAEAQALAERDLIEGDSAAAASAVLLRAARALSAEWGGRQVPSSLVAALLGLDVAQNNPWLFSKLAAGKEVKVGVGGELPAWSLPATLSATAEAFDGWRVRTAPPLALAPGGKGGFALFVTRPDEEPTTFALPVAYTLAGDGWSLTFNERYAQETLEVNQFLVAGPFKSRVGKGVDPEVHPPEIQLDITQSYDTLDGRRPWAPVGADAQEAVDLSAVFKQAEAATAHAVAVVKAVRPLQVKVAFGSNLDTLCFVNGERTGASARRDAARCVDFKAGENVIHLISSHGAGAWPLKVTLTAIDPTRPGDLRVVKACDLPKTPALMSAGEKIAEGKGLANSQGVEWKLLYSDAFDRTRLGSGWSCQSPGWMPQAAVIKDQALASEAGWGFITLSRKVAPPVRIEFDLLVGKRAMAGAYLCPEGLAWRDFWGQQKGRGYCLSLGWHDAKNNRVLRDAETVLLDEKRPPLEAGKRYRVTAQFVPPLCQLFVDGQPVLEYRDAQYLGGLDRIGLFTLGGDTFDNVRVYAP